MTTPLHSRAEVGLRPPRSISRRITAEGITVHYGGESPWRGGVFDHNRCPSIWRAWQDFHMDGRGWADVAYTSGVCPHGHRFEGRGAGVRTAAQGTNAGNQRSLAVVYIAGEGDALTLEAQHAFADEQDRLRQPLRWTHDDWHGTACPGVPMRQWAAAGFPIPGGVVVPQPGPIVVPPSVALRRWVGMARTGYGGYWRCDEQGNVHTYGPDGVPQPFHGSLAGVPLAAPIVAMVGFYPWDTPGGRAAGYWLVGADGGVFSFGAAPFYGSAGGLDLVAPIVGMVATFDGKGYWLHAADGGVFAYGTAQFHGAPTPAG